MSKYFINERGYAIRYGDERFRVQVSNVVQVDDTHVKEIGLTCEGIMAVVDGEHIPLKKTPQTPKSRKKKSEDASDPLDFEGRLKLLFEIKGASTSLDMQFKVVVYNSAGQVVGYEATRMDVRTGRGNIYEGSITILTDDVSNVLIVPELV